MTFTVHPYIPWQWYVAAFSLVTLLSGVIYWRRTPRGNFTHSSKRNKVSPESSQRSIEQEKSTLERQRISEILKAFQQKYENGAIDEDTYLALKTKYENELQRLSEEDS